MRALFRFFFVIMLSPRRPDWSYVWQLCWFNCLVLFLMRSIIINPPCGSLIFADLNVVLALRKKTLFSRGFVTNLTIFCLRILLFELVTMSKCHTIWHLSSGTLAECVLVSRRNQWGPSNLAIVCWFLLNLLNMTLITGSALIELHLVRYVTYVN